MKKSLCMATAMLLLLPAVAMAQNAFNGTWMFDISKTQVSPKPAVMTLKDGVYHCTSCVLPELTVKADGKDHPITGQPGLDAIAVKVIDDHSVLVTGRKDGKTVLEQTMTVAPDDKTATMAIIGYRGTSPVTGMATLDRVANGPAGENAVAGTWRTAKLGNFSANGLTITFRIEGDEVSMHTPTGTSYTAKLDGTAAPVRGPGKLDVSVRKLGSRTLRQTFERDGKPVDTDTLTVAADGKTLTAVDHDYVRGTTTTFVAYRQ